MPQRTWALTLLLVALVVAGLDGKLASGATGKESSFPRKNSGKKSNLVYSTWSLSSSYTKPPKPNTEILKIVEHKLLNMFGLNSRPKSKNNITISDYMWELYRKQNKLNKGLRSRTNTIRCFRGKEKIHRQPHQASFKFNIKDFPEHETVWAAELVIYSRHSSSTLSNQQKSTHRVKVFDVLRPSPKNHEDVEDPILRLVDTRVLEVSKRTSRSHWLSFDVMPALHRWRREPSTNHGLYVELDSMSSNSSSTMHHLRLKRETGESHRQWLQYQPLLVTYSYVPGDREDSISVFRTRRNVRKHRRKGRKDNCRRHALYVDFSDVGWNDWIVAPPGYDAYFCSGDCLFPLADHLNSTNHAIVQTLVNSVNPAAVPRVCCVPTELSPISMLYVDEYDKVVLKNYQDMVVQGCGCR